ncbi:TIGR04028 family ABC transporter substrate-binding protein [Corynebacterium macginleyi]|uniref:TIGR04028 family ABC transporter substrate-binding protein n=1 Tax=Corynebacterium macginleyi TaxID=38290 RepID=A0A3M0H074_9CORY|nr:TIGR04028 family ABC transporter substrate-binding protein [Corynebacterium macginleyi]MBK4145041.1 TIGR04028 family ABC transporter substrate-binding protein [Corynebacterium macginleyi]MBK4157915.1 TIGR04028 family ABC transporter substrate-binding protein [Corynebacterium macginleyi]MBK4166520.1 TIGR04028 family ABC transporter substrate-binding protein [Corynebacterium macginleyi]MBK4167057.1 TIGR04028 family ABC transporter substrate-binding protein [Corynebacterium macginleyi]QRJ58399
MKYLHRLFKPLAAVVASTALVVTLSSCADTTHAAEKGMVTYAEPNMFNNLYPPAGGYYPNGGVLNNIADRLLWQDPETLELHPWIAEDLPDTNADDTEFTFHIRKGVTYSDGSVLDAANVKKNYDLYANGDDSRMLTPSEQLPNYVKSEVIDDYTVKFYFSEPSPGFPQSTSVMNQALLSNDTLDLDDTGFSPGHATDISGSGPFVIEEEHMGTKLVLKARKDYDWAPPARKDHQGPAEIEGINVVLAAEDSVRVGSLVARQSDIARQIEAPDEKHLKDKNLQVLAAPTRGVNNSYHFHFRHPLLADKRVRQALIHAIDRDNILSTLYSGSYPKGSSILARTAVGFKDQSDNYAFDPDISRRLLDEAGWIPGEDGTRVKDGERLSLTFNESVPQPRSREMFTKVQEMLKNIGVEANLYPGDRTAQDKAMKEQDSVQVRHSMVGRANVDTLATWINGKGRNSFLNYDEGTDSYGDPKLQDMVEEHFSLKGEKERLEMSGRMQDYLSEQAYILPLFEEPQVYGFQPYVEGLTTEAIGRPSFYAVEINEEEGLE